MISDWSSNWNSKVKSCCWEYNVKSENYANNCRGRYHTSNLANTTNEFKDLKPTNHNNAHKPLTNQIRDRVPWPMTPKTLWTQQQASKSKSNSNSNTTTRSNKKHYCFYKKYKYNSSRSNCNCSLPFRVLPIRPSWIHGGIFLGRLGRPIKETHSFSS